MNTAMRALSALLPLLDVTPTPPPGADSLLRVVTYVAFIDAILCALGLMIVAGVMAVKNRRGEGMEAASSLGWVVAAMIISGSAGAIVGTFLSI